MRMDVESFLKLLNESTKGNVLANVTHKNRYVFEWIGNVYLIVTNENGYGVVLETIE
jgi:hypothetical protein